MKRHKGDPTYSDLCPTCFDKPPKGYRVKVVKVPASQMQGQAGWLDAQVFRNGELILQTLGYVTEKRDEALRVGVSRCWDIFAGNTSWS
jgi:hypothetical protein